nr:siderophore-iron reductase FhuF [Shewanella sp. SM73]
MIHWYLGELGLSQQQSQQLKQALFRRTTFFDGTQNPLYNSINLIVEPKEGSTNIQCIRRTCCLRYQLANTGQCHDCPLLSRPNAKTNAAKQAQV